MIRRTCVISVFVLVVSVMLAAPALAYGPYASYSVDAHARLAERADPAVVVWADGSSIYAQRYTGSGAGPVRTLASSLIGLSAWYADGDGTRVTVVWKAGSTVSATCMDVADGSLEYAPATVTVATDAQAIGLRGAGATVTPAGVTADGQGGAYVWCTLSPTSGAQGVGDTLLNHLSATGAAATSDPAAEVVAGGTIAGMAAVGGGHALALLQAPGRAQVAARWYGSDLTATWTKSPYLFPPGGVASSEAVAVLGGLDRVDHHVCGFGRGQGSGQHLGHIPSRP